jgi:hypothetical protein
MGDTEKFCEWLRISEAAIPGVIETIPDAKTKTIQLIQTSKSRGLKADMLPKDKSGRKEGPLYAARLIEFINEHWDPMRAAKLGRVPSLKRALSHLKRITRALQSG